MQRIVIVLLFLAGTVAVLATAEEPAATPDESAVRELSKVTLEIPTKARDRKNPVEPTAENVGRGMELFSSQCAMCHGPRGAGDGSLVTRLDLAMPDFTDANRQEQRTDGELFYILTHGHGKMPAEGERLTEEWRWCMIHAIRSMAASRPEPRGR